MNVFLWNARARNGHLEATLNHPFPAQASPTAPGKIAALWLPIMTFITLNLEHSVANMFLLPLGILSGADVSLSDALTKNILPASLGNFLAGALVKAGSDSLMFGKLGGN